MFSEIPVQWLASPPEILLVGNGPYAAALAITLGTEATPLAQIRAGPETNERGGYPQVLENLLRVILVVSESMSAEETLQCHRATWDWVAKLSSAGDQHELSFLFILPAFSSQNLESALAVGLGVPQIDPASTGHAVWRRAGSLSEMLDMLTGIRPMDLLPLRARRAIDAKHIAIAGLRATVEQGDPSAVREAAREVLAAFSGHEYHLDLFCRPPSHRHGNLLRGWLNAAVTKPVTPDGWKVARKQLADWVVEDETDRTR